MNYKHKFIYLISSADGQSSISEPEYLTCDWVCEICCKQVEDMFATKHMSYKNFGLRYEQEKWLNENCPCLTFEEKMIKQLIE